VLGAAERWLAANLAESAVVIADTSSAPTLRAHGVDATLALPLPGRDDVSTQYVLWTSRLRREAGALTTRRWRGHSIPIARFGRGLDRIQVRWLSRRSTARLHAIEMHARVSRRRAGEELVANPAIATTDSARAALTAGSLDLRAATLLALLARRSPIWVMGVVADPHAASASEPSRTLRIRVLRVGALASTVAGMPDHFRPAHITVKPNGLRSVVWRVPTAAELTVGSGPIE
jgi:hypothetical protein